MDIDKIKYIIDFSKKTGIHYALEQEDIEILEHILAERKVDKKKIEELEEKNKEILNSKIGIDLSYDDYIPKQKVKEILDKLHISDIEPWSVYKVSGDILFNLKEMVEDK